MGKVHFLVITAALLISVIVDAQNSIVYERRNGQVRANVPVGANGEAPSAIMSGGQRGGFFLATGRAATILSENFRNDSSDATEARSLHLTQIPIYSASRNYLGAFTQISEGVYIGSAHVLSQASADTYFDFLRRANLNFQSVQIFQPAYQNQFLDIAIVTDISSSDVRTAIGAVSLNRIEAGGRYLISHLSLLDGELVEQQSQGAISSSTNGRRLYLARNADAFLTWGSSGSLAFTDISGRAKLVGVVQCVVRTDVATSSSASAISYFRAIPITLILQSELAVSRLSDLQSRQAQYDLSDCGPVSGKDGGGG